MSEDTTKQRIDQRINEVITTHGKTILSEFPELRGIVIVLDYDMDDKGSLPSGAWLNNRSLNVKEVLETCRQVDEFCSEMKRIHDSAVLKQIAVMETQVQDLQRQVQELAKEENLHNGKQEEQQEQQHAV